MSIRPAVAGLVTPGIAIAILFGAIASLLSSFALASIRTLDTLPLDDSSHFHALPALAFLALALTVCAFSLHAQSAERALAPSDIDRLAGHRYGLEHLRREHS